VTSFIVFNGSGESGRVDAVIRKSLQKTLKFGSTLRKVYTSRPAGQFHLDRQWWNHRFMAIEIIDFL